MDKIEKALQQLSTEERELAREVLDRISRNNFVGLDRKKLKGHEDIFRIRKGRIRIIYRINSQEQIFILAIQRRSEKTYRDF